jgi:hypothetical protein
MTKVSKEHQSAAALEAEAKRCASRFVREERHINSLQRKLQQLVEQQKSVINASKVCCLIIVPLSIARMPLVTCVTS